MEYKEILEELSKKSKTPVYEIENEMKRALETAGIQCSVEEFIFAFRDCLLNQ